MTNPAPDTQWLAELEEPLLFSPKWEYHPKPRYYTRPTPGALNELPEYLAVCQMMGLDPMPWQRLVIRTATEYELDEAGRRNYRYREIMLVLPRQCGKTTLTLPLALLRCLLNPHSRHFFSAQTAQDASDFMRNNHMLMESWHRSLRQSFNPRRSNGSEGFACTNHSSFVKFTRGEGGLHGKTPLTVFNDEIWVMSESEGTDLVGAVRPAQATHGRRAQFWNFSTMGTISSEYMNKIVERGRREDPGLCYFEYSLDENLPADDPALWWSFHPALGNTQAFDTLQDDFKVMWDTAPGEWERAYCNRLVVADEKGVIPNWENLPASDLATVKDPVISLELSSRTSGASIAAAWNSPNGPAVAVIRHGNGLQWIVPTLTALAHEYGDTNPMGGGRKLNVFIDGAGANKRIIESLERVDGLKTHVLNVTGRQVADMDFIEHAAVIQDLHHDGAPALNEAVAGLKTKTVNGATRIDRDRSINDPAPAIAVSTALYGLTHNQKRRRAVVI